MSRRLRLVPEPPDRSPERPGPGPVPPQVLRSLDLAVMRRVESLIPGEHMTPQVGGGTDLMMIRPYRPGDDVRHIDWNVTARMQEPHVRVHIGERALTCWLLLDVSASMSFGTADRRKADVAEGVALALGHVASRHGNRLGVLSFGDDHPLTLPPRQGRTALVGLLLALHEGRDETPHGATSLGAALGRVGAVTRQRAFVAVVSDFRGPRDWRRPLLELAGRHDVVAIEIRDPREEALPGVGTLRLVDPETGRQLRVDTSNHRVRERYAAAAAAERTELARELAALGVGHVVLSTSGDWLRVLAAFLRMRMRRR